ncbi:flagellar basal body P-ring protein FlgI [Salinisphaera sp. SWV1]
MPRWVGTLLMVFAVAPPAGAQTIKALVSLSGAPDNQLVGYGLVVGLPGTGDQTTQVPYTQQSIKNMLRQMGVRLQGNSYMQPRDVAAVMVTAQLSAFKHRGQHLNVTVSAMGNAKSINGGVLLPTPLKGGNGAVYAQAQGAVLVSGYEASAAGSSSRVNTPTVGHIPGGAILAKTIHASFQQHDQTKLLLDRPDFTTAAHIAGAIQKTFGPNTAHATSPGEVVVSHLGPDRVAQMSRLMQLQVNPGKRPPQVVIDAQSGTIVMGAGVQLGPAVVSHGNLTVRVQARNGVSQPGPFSNGQTAGVTNANVAAGQSNAHVVKLPHATTLGAVARALNAIGTTSSDLIAIVQALKDAGALKAHVKVE